MRSPAPIEIEFGGTKLPALVGNSPADHEGVCGCPALRNDEQVDASSSCPSVAVAIAVARVALQSR